MKKKILEKLKDVGSSHISRSVIAMRFKDDVIKLTSFLNTNVKFSQRLWHIINDMYIFPRCPQCNNIIKKFRNLEYGYNKFCSQSCGTIFNEEKRKNTKKEKYGDENYNNPLKSKQTSVEKYGVEHFNQLDSERKRCSENCHLHDKGIIIKKKDTWIKNYGVDHPVKSNQILNKIKITKKEKYGYEYFNKTKSKETCLKQFGYKEPLLSPIIRHKIKKTNINKYGVENVFQSSIIQDQIKLTNMNKYGVEYPIQNNIIKQKVKKRRPFDTLLFNRLRFNNNNNYWPNNRRTNKGVVIKWMQVSTQANSTHQENY